MHGWNEAWDAATSGQSGVLANWALFAVGAIASCVAVCTLREIRQQGKTAYAALVAQFRPRIIVRKIELDPPSYAAYMERNGGSWRVVLSLVNRGGTVAHIQSCKAKFYWDKRAAPQTTKQICSETWETFDMGSGDRRQIEMVILSETVSPPEVDFGFVMASEGIAVLEEHREQEGFPTCSGTILYADENGAVRQTGFRRAYYLKAQQFFASGDPEHEFCD
jgi:hypothetical protein